MPDAKITRNGVPAVKPTPRRILKPGCDYTNQIATVNIS